MDELTEQVERAIATAIAAVERDELFTTIVIGRDGRVFDLRDGPFPKTPDYLPRDAFTWPTDRLHELQKRR